MLKQEVIDTIRTMSDSVTMEEIMYRLYIIDKHNKAMADIDAGRIYSTGEVRKGLAKRQ